MKKKGLLEFFGAGPSITAPTTEETLIKAVTKKRDLKGNNSPDSKKKESSN
jgi:hypothetical protein